jgi:hypothetical protein
VGAQPHDHHRPYVEDGEIVYGEYVKDKAQLGEAKGMLKELTKDFELLDA